MKIPTFAILTVTLSLGASIAPASGAGEPQGTADSEAAHLRVILHYDAGTIELVRLERAPAALRRISREASGWWAEVRGPGNTVLDSRRIGDPRILHVEWLDQETGRLRGHEVLLERATFAVTFAVDPAISLRLDLFDGERVLLASVPLEVVISTPEAPAPPESRAGTDDCSAGWDSSLVRDSGSPANRLNITFVGDGYREEELTSFDLDVQNTIDYLLSREPYSEYREFINFWQVDVISNESGADEPDYGIYKDTALDCSFNWGGTPRCLYCPSTPVYDAAGCVSETDEILVVVNTTRYGGCGGGYAVYAGKNSSATDIALHELGHSFAGLADEYAGGGTWPSPNDHSRKNCSIYPYAEMETRETKWWYWLGDEGVNTYQGCGGYNNGLYRPIWDCEMRSLNRTFCAVCEEDHILDYHARVDPVDDAQPAADPTIFQQYSATFTIVRVPPYSHDQRVAWFLDGQPVAGETGDSLVLEGEQVGLGDHPVDVNVVDDTARVRSDPSALMQSTRAWTLSVTCDGVPAEYDTDGDGICEQGRGGRDCDDDNGDVWDTPGEAAALLFDADKRTLRWDPPAQTGGILSALGYDTLRSPDPAGFVAGTVCIESGDGSDTLSIDPEDPGSTLVFHYLVRARNDCPVGQGPLGKDSSGLDRIGRDCP